MDRNDSTIPSLALLGAFILYAGARLVGRAQPEHGAGNLSAIQIALMTFATALLVYGVVGLLSVWLEGEILGKRSRPWGGAGALAAGLVLSILTAMAGGLFVRTIRLERAGAPVSSPQEGVLAGALFLLIGFTVAVYRRAFVSDEVVVESPETEPKR